MYLCFKDLSSQKGNFENIPYVLMLACYDPQQYQIVYRFCRLYYLPMLQQICFEDTVLILLNALWGGRALFRAQMEVQSTLVFSKLKGPSETLRDVPTSTYQIFRIKENTHCTTKFHERICNWTPLVRNIY